MHHLCLCTSEELNDFNWLYCTDAQVTEVCETGNACKKWCMHTEGSGHH